MKIPVGITDEQYLKMLEDRKKEAEKVMNIEDKKNG